MARLRNGDTMSLGLELRHFQGQNPVLEASGYLLSVDWLSQPNLTLE